MYPHSICAALAALTGRDRRTHARWSATAVPLAAAVLIVTLLAALITRSAINPGPHTDPRSHPRNIRPSDDTEQRGHVDAGLGRCRHGDGRQRWRGGRDRRRRRGVGPGGDEDAALVVSVGLSAAEVPPPDGCRGPGCIVQPPSTTTPAPAAPGPPGPAGPAPAGPGPAGPAPAGPPPVSSCGLFDLSSCLNELVDSVARGIVTDILEPLLTDMSEQLLITPTLAELPRVAGLWNISWEILLASYALLIVVAGAIVMGFETVQTRYGLREIAPRIVVGFLAGALSLTLGGLAIDTANGLSRGLLTAGLGTAPPTVSPRSSPPR